VGGFPTAPTELLARLVEIDSVNARLVAGGGGEAEIGRFVAEWLARAGLDVSVEEAAPGQANVIGVARGSGGGRTLLLCAHTDTVGVAGMERPFEPRIENGRLYGRGAFDMKAGLAAAMLTGAAAAERSLAGDVIVAAVADEEYASAGADALVARYTADAAIVTEPTGLDICVAHKGFVWLEVEVLGHAAHGSMPKLGVDAIAKMGHVLVGLEQLDGSLRANPTHPLLGSGSLHASLIQGGQELSSYPERCVLGVERRSVPGETQEVVEGQIRRLLDDLAARDPAFRGEVRLMFGRPAFEVDPAEEVVVVVREAAMSVLGREPALIGHTAWMDSAVLGAAGIPTVIFGPGGAGAHATVEWVELADLDRCVDVLVATAERFCASP
jgi:acetylornithine deacetylase